MAKTPIKTLITVQKTVNKHDEVQPLEVHQKYHLVCLDVKESQCPNYVFCRATFLFQPAEKHIENNLNICP